MRLCHEPWIYFVLSKSWSQNGVFWGFHVYIELFHRRKQSSIAFCHERTPATNLWCIYYWSITAWFPVAFFDGEAVHICVPSRMCNSATGHCFTYDHSVANTSSPDKVEVMGLLTGDLEVSLFEMSQYHVLKQFGRLCQYPCRLHLL